MQALFLACIRAHEADYWRIVFQVPGYIPFTGRQYPLQKYITISSKSGSYNTSGV